MSYAENRLIRLSYIGMHYGTTNTGLLQMYMNSKNIFPVLGAIMRKIPADNPLCCSK
jgi:hypothetical protein